jgi:hypothetical protein
MAHNKVNTTKNLTLLILYTLICKNSPAKDLYIDYNFGSDSNIGTFDKPLETINDALNKADSNSS